MTENPTTDKPRRVIKISYVLLTLFIVIIAFYIAFRLKLKWKNFLFIIITLILLLLQTSFWLVSSGCAITDQDPGAAITVETTEKILEVNEIEKAAKQVVGEDSNTPVQAPIQLGDAPAEKGRFWAGRSRNPGPPHPPVSNPLAPGNSFHLPVYGEYSSAVTILKFFAFFLFVSM